MRIDRAGPADLGRTADSEHTSLHAAWERRPVREFFGYAVTAAGAAVVVFLAALGIFELRGLRHDV